MAKNWNSYYFIAGCGRCVEFIKIERSHLIERPLIGAAFRDASSGTTRTGM